MTGARAPTSARARAMSSRYCRHDEYEAKAEVTKASARRTPSSAIRATVSARSGCQLRLPQ